MWLDDVLCSAWNPEDIAPAASAIRLLLRQRHRLMPDQEDDFNVRHPEELIRAEIDQTLDDDERVTKPVLHCPPNAKPSITARKPAEQSSLF